MAPVLHPKGGFISVGEGRSVDLQSVQTKGLRTNFSCHPLKKTLVSPLEFITCKKKMRLDAEKDIH